MLNTYRNIKITKKNRHQKLQQYIIYFSFLLLFLIKSTVKEYLIVKMCPISDAAS